MNPYPKINWENYPSTDTPMDAVRLNKMDNQIYDLTEQKSDKSNIINVTLLESGWGTEPPVQQAVIVNGYDPINTYAKWSISTSASESVYDDVGSCLVVVTDDTVVDRLTFTSFK